MDEALPVLIAIRRVARELERQQQARSGTEGRCRSAGRDRGGGLARIREDPQRLLGELHRFDHERMRIQGGVKAKPGAWRHTGLVLCFRAGVVVQIMGHDPSASIEKRYAARPLDLLRMQHERTKAWTLEQAGLPAVADDQPAKLRAVK